MGSPAAVAAPMVLAIVGVLICIGTGPLALGPSVADVEQPVARAVFLMGLVLMAGAAAWLLLVLRRRKR